MASSFRWGGREWGPGDQAAFATWLRRHGASYGSWARSHPGAAKLLAPVTVETLAQQSLQPELDALDAERKKAAASAQAQIQNTQGIYGALAQALKGLAPATQDVYHQASGATAGFAKGFADATAAQQSGEASSLKDFLGKIGAPAGAVQGAVDKVGGQGVQDVQYGLGGYIPASTLEREGAGFTAAALQQPFTALGTGAQQATILGRQGLSADQEFASQRQQILDKLPSIIADLRQRAAEQRRADEALRLQEAYLGLSSRKTDAALTGIDPATGQPTYEARSDAARAARDAASARARSQADAREARRQANNDREDAFRVAQKELFAAAQDLVPKPDPNALIQKPAVKPAYAAAKRNLFNQYSYLLNYATRSGRGKLKKRLNRMIDQALASVGIYPPKRQARPVRPDDRPGPFGP